MYLINNNTSNGAPTIVIAVRGSQGFFDWVVNTNCDMEDASEIIVREYGSNVEVDSL